VRLDVRGKLTAGVSTARHLALTNYVNVSIPRDRWTHVTLLYDGAACRLFMNGLPIAGDVWADLGGLVPTEGQLHVGGAFSDEMVGLMDEEIWGVWNDTDYLMRMERKGLKMYQNRAVLVDHLRSKTEWEDPKFDMIYKRNEQVFYHKHCGAIEHDRKFNELYRGYVNRQAIKGERYDEEAYVKFVHDCQERSRESSDPVGER